VQFGRVLRSKLPKTCHFGPKIGVFLGVLFTRRYTGTLLKMFILLHLHFRHPSKTTILFKKCAYRGVGDGQMRGINRPDLSDEIDRQMSGADPSMNKCALLEGNSMQMLASRFESSLCCRSAAADPQSTALRASFRLPSLRCGRSGRQLLEYELCAH
jgi:hypothetical protein